MLEASATQRRPAASSAIATVAIALVWRALLAASRAWLGPSGPDRQRRATATLAAAALLGAVLLSGEAPARSSIADEAALPAELAARVAVPGPATDDSVGAPSTAGMTGPFLADGTLLKPELSWAGGPIGTSFSIRTYTVRSGDTLTGIAARFGVSMMTVWWANDLTATNVLRIGQRLRIPPVTGILYAVREGDSLASIAAATQADRDAIRRFNALSSDTLLIGQLLMIPGGVGAPLPTPVPTPVPTPRPTARPTAAPTPTPTPLQPLATYTGIASWMSVDGLAARLATGTLVRVCGSGGCIERRVTDWGPSDTSRIVDLYSGDFTVVCGCSLSVGLTEVRLDVLPG